MIAYIKLYSKKNGEINNFLSKYYNSNMGLENQKNSKSNILIQLKLLTL